MSEQFFTDDKMFVLAALFFVALLAIGAILLYWRDWEVVWVGALATIQLLAVVYFYTFWLRPDSPIVLFPETNLLIRPYTVSLWILVLAYSGVRLLAKRQARKR